MTASIWKPNGFSPEIRPLYFFEYIATSGQTTFSIAPYTVILPSQIKVYVDGKVKEQDEFTVVGTDIILDVAVAVGIFVRIDIYFATIARPESPFPGDTGHAGEFLSTDGAGNVFWDVPPGGSSPDSFMQVGAGAVLRTYLNKLQDAFNALDFGATGDGVTDNTVILQNALTAAAGKVLVLEHPGIYVISDTLVMSATGSSFILGKGVTIDYSAVPSYSALLISGADSLLQGGKWLGPSSWNGVNTAPTYGVIKVAATRVEVRDLILTNIRKLGIWVKDVEDVSIYNCFLEGNYPSGSWTGVETGHWGVLFDPGVGSSGGNFKLQQNTIKSCVQGCQPSNYGAGPIVRGVLISGNIFEACWNHGIYTNFSNGATIVGNEFNRCQIPVVLSGDYNVVSGNAMYTATSTIGDERDITGISVRDGSFNVISNNTIRGVLSPPGNVVCINIQDVSGVSDLIGNVITGNTIDLPDGEGVGIRIATSTRISAYNIIAKNVIRSKGSPTEALIGVYGQTGKVPGAISNVTQANPGVITNSSAHGLVVDELVTIVDVQGMTQIAGTYKVNTVPGAFTITLKNAITGVALDTSAFTAYTSGGEIRKATVQHIGNKIVDNNVIATAKTFGVYLICQVNAMVANNSVEYAFNLGAPASTSTIAMFDSYNCQVLDNLSVIRPQYGQNLAVQGFREFSGTITQQRFNHIVRNSLDGVRSALGGTFQPIESLANSGLLLEQSSAFAPSTACAPGSTWKNTSGGVGNTFWVKQSGLGSAGWVPYGVAAISAAAADLANKASSINTLEKYAGKLVWDTTNSRMMRASGSIDVSTWVVVDGSVTVTPA